MVVMTVIYVDYVFFYTYWVNHNYSFYHGILSFYHKQRVTIHSQPICLFCGGRNANVQLSH